MWADGVAFSMLVGATRYDGRRYRPYLSAFFDGMDGYTTRTPEFTAYNAYPQGPGGSDKYYDDNAWMVITFVEAYEVTRDGKYLRRAIDVLRYVLSGWDDKLGGGIYWREDRKGKNTCSNGPSAVAALAVARHTDGAANVDWARKIVDWTRRNLQDPADGLYWDGIDAQTRQIGKTKWTYNTALMIRAHLGLWLATRERPHRDEAVRLAAAAEKEFVLPETGAFRDDAVFTHLLCEAYLQLWLEVRQPWLRARAEANGIFAVTRLKDTDGGYREKWRIPDGTPQPRKTLMANAATSRFFWCLAK
jgi:rhamnogalacturonyl hydrolase YesR